MGCHPTVLFPVRDYFSERNIVGLTLLSTDQQPRCRLVAHAQAKPEQLTLCVPAALTHPIQKCGTFRGRMPHDLGSSEFGIAKRVAWKEQVSRCLYGIGLQSCTPFDDLFPKNVPFVRLQDGA